VTRVVGELEHPAVAAASGEQIEIAHAEQRAVIVEVGGGLRTYTAGGNALLDGYDAGEMSSSGRGQVLIHGLVRWASWTVAEREPHRVVMEHMLHPRPGYPFSLLLAIEYQLSEDGLRVQTTATNRGPAACPFGSGAHPYLTVGTETVDAVTLRVPGRTVLSSDERGIPVGVGSVDGTACDFRRPRPIGDVKLDTAFTNLERDEDGLARVELRNPRDGRGLTLWVDESYPYLMVFSGDPLPDVARRSLAVEPMTCPPNAFQTGVDLIRLEPGRSFTSTWGIRPS
jgi:aldose 1-epimerase